MVILIVVMVAIAQKLAIKEPNSYAFIAFVTPLALNMLGLLILLMYSAGLVSSEIGSGSIRLVLVRPVRRHDLIFAKILLAMSYAVLLTVCVGAAAWGMAAVLGPFNGITLADELIFSGREMAGAYLIGAVVALLPQFAAAAYAVMVSTLIRSTGGAVGAAVGLWILTDLIKYPLGIERYVFSTYVERPWRVFIGRCDGLNPSWFPDINYCMFTALVFFVFFTGAAVLALSRKDFRV